MRTAMLGMMGLTAMALGGCTNDRMETGMPVANAMSATATILDANGRNVGRATAPDVAGGIRYTIDSNGLPPGTQHLIVKDLPTGQ